MANFFKITLVVALIAACSAEPQRFRNVRTNRFSARQEVASDAPTAKAPYPPAGIKPDVPFDLPTETTPQPQPDNSYLPPESVPDSTYGPPTTVAPVTEVQPEAGTDLPEILIEDDDDTESVISVAVSYDDDNGISPVDAERFVIDPRTQPLRSSNGRSQKLRAVRAQPIFLDDGSFAYSAQLQNW